MQDSKQQPHTNETDLPASAQSDSVTLNFKVSVEFKKQFKGYAVSRDISMVELLKEGFALIQKNH